MNLTLERWNLDFDIEKSIRYHAARRDFFRALANTHDIIILVAGLAAVGGVLAKLDELFIGTATGFISIFAVFAIALRVRDRAIEHEKLYRDYSALGRDIAGVIHPSEEQIAVWKSRRLEIEMEEPDHVDLLERRCAAETAIARGRELRPQWQLTEFQKLGAQFIFWRSRVKSK